MKQTTILTVASMFLFAWIISAGGVAIGQNKAPQPDPHAQHQAQGQPSSQSPAGAGLADEIAKLKAKMADLETALHQKHSGAAMQSGGPKPMGPMRQRGAPMGQPGMQSGGTMPGMNMPPASQSGGGMQGGSMPMMDDDMMMGNMGGGMGGMNMMQMMQQMESMEMMGMMGNMGGQSAMSNSMAMTSALPGFPGASHIYHIGATDFFLDHPQHITLTLEQKTALNAIKQKSIMEQSEFDRKMEQAEQELWQLTASDQPDAGQIDAKVRGIGNLQADKRITFIKAVGEAAKLLTDEQRKALLGQSPPQGGSSGMSDM
jgi:hypothetical protein